MVSHWTLSFACFEVAVYSIKRENGSFLLVLLVLKASSMRSRRTPMSLSFACFEVESALVFLKALLLLVLLVLKTPRYYLLARAHWLLVLLVLKCCFCCFGFVGLYLCLSFFLYEFFGFCFDFVLCSRS